MLITGCDNESGFGFKTAATLVRRGFHVIACCFDADAACTVCRSLKVIAQSCGIKEERIRTLVVDVRNTESVNACVDAVRQYTLSVGSPLWALVNNAGVQSGALVDWNSMHDYEVHLWDQVQRLENSKKYY